MSEDDKEQESTHDEQDAPTAEDLSDEGKEQVKQMRQAYDDDRQTAVLPGTDNTITGVAINEWLDDDGNPKFGQDEQQGDGGDDTSHETAGEKQTEDAG
jgi:hypothetical protein